MSNAKLEEIDIYLKLRGCSLLLEDTPTEVSDISLDSIQTDGVMLKNCTKLSEIDVELAIANNFGFEKDS